MRCELALSMKDEMKENVHITTLSFGNEKTEEILRESLALGVDRAILVNDERMRGCGYAQHGLCSRCGGRERSERLMSC